MGVLKSRKASSIDPHIIDWLWPDRIPMSMLTVLAGDPDQGKGLVTIDLTATLTTGKAFPDCPNPHDPLDVAMLFCEDPAAPVVRPRLDAAGADIEHVDFIDSNIDGRLFSLDRDASALEEYVIAHPDVKLIIIDPVSSFLGSAKMEKEQEIRKIFAPLARIAEQYEVAIVLVMHHNKRSDVSALHKVMGAVAMTGVARVAWLCVTDPENPSNHFFLCTKMNIGRRPQNLQYRTVGRRVAINEYVSAEVGCIEWGGPIEMTAEDALSPDGIRSSVKFDSAVKWLQEYLEFPFPAVDVLKAASEADISKKTLYRAKKKLGVISTRENDVWLWSLP